VAGGSVSLASVRSTRGTRRGTSGRRWYIAHTTIRVAWLASATVSHVTQGLWRPRRVLHTLTGVLQTAVNKATIFDLNISISSKGITGHAGESGGLRSRFGHAVRMLNERSLAAMRTDARTIQLEV